MKKKEDHQFDEQVRLKMSQLRPDTGMPDWDAFEGRLDASEGLDAGPAQLDPREIDEAIFSKIHQYEVPYEPSHWYLMESMLNEWFTWPRYVLRYKSMELALFLLLFITCWQYLPKKSAPLAGAAPAQNENYSVPSSPILSQLEDIQKSGVQTTVVTEERQQPGAFATTPDQAATSDAAAAIAKSAVENANLSAGTSITDNALVLPSATKNNLNELTPLATVFALEPVRSSRATTIELPLVGREHLTVQGDTQEALSVTDLLPGLPFEALVGPTGGLGNTKVQRIKKGPTLIVGMFGSADYNHIVVPASSEKRLAESFERAALGYGGGLSLSADFGRLEVETGAIYAARHYPVGIVYVRGGLLSGLWGDELRTTELNMLNIPLHFRYDYLQRNKWRAYVLAGGSVQVAFQTNYYTAEAPQYDFMPAMPAMPPPVTDGGGESEIDRIRRNGKGWLESGSFEDNAYLTFNMGFGAERYFSERWSLFVQPVYQHSVHYFKNIDGLGPNNDQINSLSVLFGTRVRLK
jgi:hypothetical protein